MANTSFILFVTSGCATPQYALRGTPTPDESARTVALEQEISAQQAQMFAQQGARPLGVGEIVRGLRIQEVVDRISQVTERPSLHYRVWLYHDADPNAAALADGRIYVSSGLITYLAGRGNRADELAFIVGHEIAHTVAQHLVRRFQTIQQHELLKTLVALGASAAGGATGAQEASQLALDITSFLSDVSFSGYSQDQELEADQLGIRYVIRAGLNPLASLDLLEDFARFDYPWTFLRTHPYMTERRAYLVRYLQESGVMGVVNTGVKRGADATTERLKQLRDVQALYPNGSLSWQNLQRQIDALEHRR